MKISTAQEAINGNSNDTVITPLRLKQVLKSKNISGEGSSGGITTETDPIFTSSPAANITDEDIENWNNPPIPNVPDEVKVGGSSANISSGTDIWVKIAKNLYNQIVKSTGICLTSTGSTQNDYSYWGVSDYIEVSPSTDYVLSGINYSSTSRYMVWYDENKAIISTFARYMPTKYDYVTVKSPANAKYIRFTLFIGASDNAIVDERTTFQFEKGTVATSYMPYSGNKNTFMVNNSNGSYSDFYDLFPVNVESGVVEETDPTVPDYVKQITQEDIDKWNSGTGGGSGDFDGEVEPNELIQAGVTDRVSLTISSAWQLSEVLFNTETVKIGTGLTLTENGHIKIGSGINKVRIEGNLLVSSTAVGTLDARLYRLREGTYTNIGGYYVHLDKTADYRTCLLSIPVLDVEENDEICIRVTSDTACTLTIANNAHLYVEKINENNVIVGGSGGNIDTDDITSKMSKVLYDNPDGTNTTVQLTETYTNFKYLEVFCVSSDTTYAYTRIDNPVDGKRATVMGGWFDTYSYFKNCVLVLSGSDKINVTQGNASEITGANKCNSVSMANAMKVVKVVGYYDENVLIVGNNIIDGIPIGSEFEYVGEEVPDGYEEVIEDETEDDTGWQNATLTSYFKPYNNNEEYTPVYRKVGKLVEIKGTLSPSSAQAAGWTATMFVLPDGFRPSQVVSVLCQGSGQNKWQLMVNPNGEVVMDRYSGTSNVAIPSTAWLIFQAMFFVD